MLSSISWSTYLSILIAVVLFYYAAIGYKYYRHDFLWLINSKANQQQVDNPQQQASQQTVALVGLPYLVQSFSDEVAGYLQQVALEKNNTHSVMLGLRRIASKYPTLNGSAYQSSLEQLVIHEAATYCQLPLEADAVKEIWKQG